MSKIMIAAALSTQQELVNALALIQLHNKCDIRFSRIDSLQTETAERNQWSQRLKDLLELRHYGKHRDMPFGFEDPSHEYNPDQITQSLLTYYQSKQEPIAWLYSGAQKPQAIGLFQTFKERLKQGYTEDIAVSLETSHGRKQLHILHMEDGQLAHQAIDTEVDLSIEEYALLFGQRFQDNAGYQVWPTLERRWDDRYPKGQHTHQQMTEAFGSRAKIRHELMDWPSGKHAMFNASGKPMRYQQNDPYTAFFEHAVVERLERFLQRHPEHQVIEARANCFRQSSAGTKVEYDVLLTLRSGDLIAFDAKAGSSKDSYRKQKRGVEEIGGWNASLYYVSPWFPRYIDRDNCDDTRYPWDPMRRAETETGGPVFTKEQSHIQRVYKSWETIDETFGREWNPSDEARKEFGHRPPDYLKHPQFHSSLLIPFDACQPAQEALFEARLQRLLCPKQRR